MKFAIVSIRDLLAGLMFMAIGSCWMIAASQYRMGTAAQMGPGYFPFACSLLLFVLGLASVIRSLRVKDTEAIGRWPVAALFFIPLGIVLFGLLTETAGLVAASVALIVMSCYARLRSRPIEVAVLSILLTALVVAIFVYGIRLPLSP